MLCHPPRRSASPLTPRFDPVINPLLPFVSVSAFSFFGENKKRKKMNEITFN